MELELEYFLLLIEKDFYEKNSSLLCKETICNAQKKLPCNCLTGLSMNYWGYVIKNCYNVDWENIFDIKGNNISCILTTYRGKGLIPVMLDKNEKIEYLFSDKKCIKEEVSSDKVYIQETCFEDYAHMLKYISDIEPKCGNRITEYGPIYDFLSYFIIAVRTQPIEKESRVLLTIMLFFFPNRTMKLVLEYLNNAEKKENQKNIIKEFVEEYGVFLNDLAASDDYGFLTDFSTFFKKLTGIYVGEWLEEINSDLKEEFLRQTLVAAYNRNVEEKNRRNSYYKEIISKR